jgi:hypothetical protein
MDGAPVYNLVKETLMGCRITEVKGILNATTNFILTEMEKGVSFEDAVEDFTFKFCTYCFHDLDVYSAEVPVPGSSVCLST